MIYFQEGQIPEAETMKLKLEQAQRERRVAMEGRGESHVARWFEKKVTQSSAEEWVTNDKYWVERKDPGFSKKEFLKLW